MRTSRLSNSIRLFWLALLMLSASAVCAQSVPTDAAQYHYELGITAAERNNYQKALEEFQTSYAIRQVPRLLINIGRAHHRLGNLREAIDVYESYLRIELNAPLSVVIQVKDFLKKARAEFQIIQTKKTDIDTPTKTIYIKEERSSRPLWRWLVGGAIAAGGLSILSLGAYSWAHDGSCVSMAVGQSKVCENIYDTKSVGIPMVVVGGLTLAVGTAMMAWPGKKIRREVEIR